MSKSNAQSPSPNFKWERSVLEAESYLRRRVNSHPAQLHLNNLRDLEEVALELESFSLNGKVKAELYFENGVLVRKEISHSGHLGNSAFHPTEDKVPLFVKRSLSQMSLHTTYPHSPRKTSTKRNPRAASAKEIRNPKVFKVQLSPPKIIDPENPTKKIFTTSRRLYDPHKFSRPSQHFVSTFDWVKNRLDEDMEAIGIRSSEALNADSDDETRQSKEALKSPPKAPEQQPKEKKKNAKSPSKRLTALTESFKRKTHDYVEEDYYSPPASPLSKSLPTKSISRSVAERLDSARSAAISIEDLESEVEVTETEDEEEEEEETSSSSP